MKTLILSLVFLSAFNLKAENLNDYNQVPASEITNSYALSSWQPVDGYTTNPLDLNSVHKISLNCANKNLYPTHADQSTKEYHQFLFGTYDLEKLKYNDEACTLPSKYKNGSGQYYCQMADTIYSAVISDTYRDTCGNLYRAFWRITYLKQNDNMGTLLSRGRTLYPNPASDYPGDIVLGGTYIQAEKDFVFLSPLFAGDEAAIQRAFKRNQTPQLRYNPNTLLFEEVHP